jgi:hypothetical protein
MAAMLAIFTAVMKIVGLTASDGVIRLSRPTRAWKVTLLIDTATHLTASPRFALVSVAPGCFMIEG